MTHLTHSLLHDQHVLLLLHLRPYFLYSLYALCQNVYKRVDVQSLNKQ